jgi:hypothetical protein
MVRKLHYIIALLVLSTSLHAQCFSFAKNVCKPALGDYVHDGNYNATILSEGESADLYKTFFSGQKYRVVIGKVKSLPNIRFQIVNQNDDVLYDNSDHNYALTWDFEVESTQQLIIHLEVDEADKSADTQVSGCVAILFGIEEKKRK